MIVLGFDPGLHGGCAALRDGTVVSAVPMFTVGGEVDSAAVADWVRSVSGGTDGTTGVRAAVERVSAMPGQGVSSMFKFGTGWGMVRGVLSTLRVPTYLVTPQAWKKVVLAGTQKDKDAAVAWCRSAHPEVQLVQPGCRTPHDGVADSIAIAEYLYRQNRDAPRPQ